jgi:hypothetical protein
MAFGSVSSIFRKTVADTFDRTHAFDLDTDAFKVALYNNTTTPDKDSALFGYNQGTSQWVVANEVIDTTGGASWPTGGRPLVTPDITTPAAGVIMWDAVDTASADATADIANSFGCLVYDDTLTTPVADPGVCFLSFGGSATSVTNGTYTIIYHANGIFRITVT